MNKGFGAVVIGSSAGGLRVLISLLESLPHDYPIAVIVVQHRRSESTQLLEEVLQIKCKIRIKQADEKEKIYPGIVYVAPPGYHLLIERDKSFSLSSDRPVNYSMPSIDVTFETAAEVYQRHLLGIILTGANQDGANGIKSIKKLQGFTVAQDPAEAEYPVMPQAAIDTHFVDKIMPSREIKKFLLKIQSSENL
jgi:two-component system, chemotaxis family, protein-glutamate methylesterase/glutaminase